MKLISGVKRAAVLFAAVLAAGAGGSAIAAGPILKSGDISQASMWYGRAGGLVGAERVTHLEGNSAATQVGVAYDKDVAARTNMSSDRAGGTSVRRAPSSARSI